MNEDLITQYITDTFDGVDFVVASGDTFFGRMTNDEDIDSQCKYW